MSALIERLKQLGAGSVRPLDGVQEKVVFPLPKGLNQVTAVVQHELRETSMTKWLRANLMWGWWAPWRRCPPAHSR